MSQRKLIVLLGALLLSTVLRLSPRILKLITLMHGATVMATKLSDDHSHLQPIALTAAISSR